MNKQINERILKTKRLTLIAGTLAIARAEIDDIPRFASLLDADIPVSWPPPLNDTESMEWFATLLKEDPDAVGWANWYFILHGSRGKRKIAIGNGGFKGKPTPDGTVEIGYSIMEDYQRNGYAPEAVAAMMDWAFQDPGVKRIIAETYPDLVPSVRVLEKNGFNYIGKGSEEDIIRFERLPAT
ncbi:MAG: GNAT family N-acetyltransferase [bacterium]|nr:GNAT family N-acetyltransferase [bacterium]